MKKIFALPLFLVLLLLYVVFRYAVLVPICAIYARMRGVMVWADAFELRLAGLIDKCGRQL
jgi:preprotein translocase subunit SecF